MQLPSHAPSPSVRSAGFAGQSRGPGGGRILSTTRRRALRSPAVTSYHAGHRRPPHWCCSTPASSGAGRSTRRCACPISSVAAATRGLSNHATRRPLLRDARTRQQRTTTGRVVTAQSPQPGATIDWHGEATLTVTNVLPDGPRARAPPDRTSPRPQRLSPSCARTRCTFYRRTRKFRRHLEGRALPSRAAPGTRVAWHGEITVQGSYDASPPPRRPVATVATPLRSRPARSSTARTTRSAIATWYNYIPGRCATWYLPKGTVITVRDLATGRSITCVISDREARSAQITWSISPRRSSAN